MGLKDRPLSCLVSRLEPSELEGRAKGKGGDLLSSRPRFLSESVGQFAVEDGEARGASFRTGVQRVEEPAGVMSVIVNRAKVARSLCD